MKPSVQVQNVKEQVNQRNEPRPTLPGITLVTAKLVLTTVRLPRLGDPNPDDGVENQRRKNQAPLDQRKQFSGAVDQKDRPLESLCPIQQAGVRRKVYCHVQTERNDAQQGMDSPNDKLMAEKKVGFGVRLRAHLWVLTGYESTTMQP